MVACGHGFSQCHPFELPNLKTIPSAGRGRALEDKIPSLRDMLAIPLNDWSRDWRRQYSDWAKKVIDQGGKSEAREAV
jgi:hypothetical protein